MSKKILLAVCGGISAYKAAELVRLLRKQQAQVQVVMTEAATHFISALTFQALSGNPVQTQLFDSAEEQVMGHIRLARWADLIVIAPATSNMIAKLSYGFADDLVSTLCLAATCPIYIAPAMNQAMWHNFATQENIQRLQQRGLMIINPEQGEQACGETGFGRMSEPATICLQIMRSPPDSIDNKKEALVTQTACVLENTGALNGVKILISAGPTREPLDPVRYISNRSSGKMGYALVEAALQAGATVTLVTGPVTLESPPFAEVIRVETAEQMYQTILPLALKCDIYIGAAAVADYTPLHSKEQKIKTQAQESTIILQKTKDILSAVASLPSRPFVVGFAAETNDLEIYAKGKLVRKKLDMIAANWVGKEQGGFEKDENGLHVFWHNGTKILAMTDKKQLAKQLLALIIERRNEKNTAKNTG
jgi:phosphopantothenoylcysteine decarboxylase/phosphopantothenate--cysteine ligase